MTGINWTPGDRNMDYFFGDYFLPGAQGDAGGDGSGGGGGGGGGGGLYKIDL